MIRHLAARALRSLADALDGVTESDVQILEGKVGRLALQHDHTREALAAMLREGVVMAEGWATDAREVGVAVDEAKYPIGLPHLPRARELLRVLEARP